MQSNLYVWPPLLSHLWLFLWLLFNHTYFFKSSLSFTKEYLLSVCSHKGPSIFNLGTIVFGSGTQWFWNGTHDFSQDES